MDPAKSIDMTVEDIKERLQKVNRCGVCGASKVEIRGRHPGDDRREVCPTCLAERMDDIREI